jgi:5-methylcytosine-specific restriction protein A
VGYERDRGSARSRGYNTRWDKAAATFKQRNPHCLGCTAVGLTVKVDVVDHVEPHKGDQAKFWNTKMWQPACRHHHDVIKPQLERMFLEGQIPIAELWLNSATAVALSKRRPAPRAIGADGWPV